MPMSLSTIDLPRMTTQSPLLIVTPGGKKTSASLEVPSSCRHKTVALNPLADVRGSEITIALNRYSGRSGTLCERSSSLKLPPTNPRTHASDAPTRRERTSFGLVAAKATSPTTTNSRTTVMPDVAARTPTRSPSPSPRPNLRSEADERSQLLNHAHRDPRDLLKLFQGLKRTVLETVFDDAARNHRANSREVIERVN